MNKILVLTISPLARDINISDTNIHLSIQHLSHNTIPSEIMESTLSGQNLFSYLPVSELNEPQVNLASIHVKEIPNFEPNSSKILGSTPP